MHLDYPFAGSRMLQTLVWPARDIKVGAAHRHRSKRMGIEAIYRLPNTSKPAPGHTIFPYLLRKLPVTRPESGLGDGYHVYPLGAGLRLSCGRRRLVQLEGSGMEVIDYTGNGVLSGGGRGGSCPIWQAGDFKTDQGSQFSSIAFTGLLFKNEIKISMDGKGAWRDNIFVERLWRTIKYEEVYLRAYANVPEARASIGRYIDGFYKAKRPHSSLDRRTPDEAYFTALQPIAVAA